jgi:hypothetical protein
VQDLQGGNPVAFTLEISQPFYMESQLVLPDAKYVPGTRSVVEGLVLSSGRVYCSLGSGVESARGHRRMGGRQPKRICVSAGRVSRENLQTRRFDRRQKIDQGSYARRFCRFGLYLFGARLARRTDHRLCVPALALGVVSGCGSQVGRAAWQIPLTEYSPLAPPAAQ